MKMRLLLLFILTISLTFLGYTQEMNEDAPKREEKEVPAEESELFLEAIKEKKVADQLLQSELLKDCQNDSNVTSANTPEEKKDELRKCVAAKLGSVSDKEMKEISEKLQLGSFDKEAAKTTKSIRDYLNQRLSEAIYGADTDAEGKLKALKDRNIADHGIYYQLYIEQIGKNTLLNVSKYCLENFGYNKPEQLIDINLGSEIRIYDILTVDPNNADTYIINTARENRKNNLKDIAHMSLEDFWKEAGDGVNTDKMGKIREYKVCTKKKLSDCEDQFNSRTVEMLEQIKLAEYKLGESSTDASYFKDRYSFCATQVVKNMCEIFKCRNVYNDKSDADDIKRCKEEFNIPVQASSTTADDLVDKGLATTNTTGQVACNVMEELGRYRKMMLATQDIQGKMKKDFGVLTSLGQDITSSSVKDIYDGSGRGKKKKLDELTSISAKELTQEVDQIAGSAEEAEQLRNDCLDDAGKLVDGWENNESCKKLKAKLTSDTITNIEAEAEASALAYVKQFKELTSRDELIEFMEKNGLTDLMKMPGFDDMEAPELKVKLEEHYKAEKMAGLAAIKDRFMQEARLKENPEDATEEAENVEAQNKVAQETIEDMEQHKKRMETLFQYSNIISSYLPVTDKDGNELGSNSTGRQMEADNLIDDESKDYITGFYSEGTSSSGGGSGGVQSMDYIQVLDAILDPPAEDPAP